MQADASDVTLIVTEPMFNPDGLRECMDQLVFEELGFAQYACLPGGSPLPGTALILCRPHSGCPAHDLCQPDDDDGKHGVRRRRRQR